MIFDTDAHVEECPETFALLTGKEEWKKAAPRIHDGATRAYWIIEGKVFPKQVGRGVFTFGTPHASAKGSTVDPARKTTLDSQVLSDPKARLLDMDKEGIDISVVFPTLFLTYPLAEDPRLSALLCHSYSEWVAERCRQTKGRIRWVAPVPLPDVEAAVEEVERAKSLGACGILTLGTAGEMNLDDPRLDPFYARLEEAGLPLCVHVGWSYPPLTNLYTNIYRSQSCAFLVPIFMAFVSLIGGGVLDRFPRLTVGFFEAGVEWIPFWVDRLERLRKQPPGGTTKKDLPDREPLEYIASGRVYFSCELDEKRISMVTEAIGDDCILYASDLPHAHRVFSAVELFTRRTDIPEATKKKILGDNGARFYGAA